MFYLFERINILLLDAENNPIIGGARNRISKSMLPHGSMGKPSGLEFIYTLFCYGAIFFAAYWFLIRPQKKRQKELLDRQNKLKPGDNIITSAGLHGKIIEVNERTVLVEFGLNKGIRIPVDKNHILDFGEDTYESIDTTDQ